MLERKYREIVESRQNITNDSDYPHHTSNKLSLVKISNDSDP